MIYDRDGLLESMAGRVGNIEQAVTELLELTKHLQKRIAFLEKTVLELVPRPAGLTGPR